MPCAGTNSMSTAKTLITVGPVPIGASIVQYSEKKAIISPSYDGSILQQKKTAEHCRNCRIDPEDLIAAALNKT